jgi:hypothetical protein
MLSSTSNKKRIGEFNARRMNTSLYRSSIKHAVQQWKALYPLVKHAPSSIVKALHGLAEPLDMTEDNRFRDRRGKQETAADNTMPTDSLKY